MAKELSSNQKREWAELLYTKHNETQKAIAAKVGVHENTVTAWKEKYRWDAARKSLLASKESILKSYYTILENIVTRIQSGDGVGNTADADMSVKYAAAINKLETETNVGNMIETGMKFIQEVQSYDLELAKQIATAFNTFISNQLKRF